MNKTNYNDIFEKTAAERRGDKLLLHCCCAPCTLGVVERVTAFFDVTTDQLLGVDATSKHNENN